MLGRPAEVHGRQVGLSCHIPSVRRQRQRTKADGVYFRRRFYFAPPVAFFLVERLALFLVERFAFFLVDPLAFFRRAVFFVAIFMAPSNRHPLDLGCYGLPFGYLEGEDSRTSSLEPSPGPSSLAHPNRRRLAAGKA